jgi:hypothetical protein
VFLLTSWDIVVSGPALQSTWNGSGSFVVQTELNLTSLGLGFGFTQVDSIEMERIVGGNVYQLTLPMLDPPGFFRGEVMLQATDTMTSIVGSLGTGLVLTPRCCPEPGCDSCAVGLGVLAAFRRRLSK